MLNIRFDWSVTIVTCDIGVILTVLSPICTYLMQMDLTLNFLFPWLWKPFLVARINWFKKNFVMNFKWTVSKFSFWTSEHRIVKMWSPKVAEKYHGISLTFSLLKLKVCKTETRWSVLFEGVHPSSSWISILILDLDKLGTSAIFHALE